MKEYDVVQLKDGRTGTIMCSFKDGAAFMVEICDEKGKMIDMPTVEEKDIEKIMYEA